MDRSELRRAPNDAVALPSLADSQRAVAALVSRVLPAELRNFRTLSADEAWQAVVAKASLPVATRLTREGRELASSVLADCESLASWAPAGESVRPPSTGSFELAMDSAVERLPRERAPLSAVDDIAFLVQLELVQRVDRLSQLGPAADPLAVLSECDSALRRVRKGMGAIDAAIAAHLGARSRIEFGSELADSLAVRKAYGRARRFVRRIERAGIDRTSGLRQVAARLELLAEGHVAPSLRIRDRLDLLALRGRILRHVTAVSVEPVETERLWSDVQAFVEMLSQVNRRQELVAHDRAALAALVAESAPQGGPARDAALLALEGLDDELDEALAVGGEGVDGALRSLALRMGA